MPKKRGSIRPSEDTMDKFNKLISKIHIKSGKKLTHEEYMKQSMVLMEKQYKVKDEVK